MTTKTFEFTQLSTALKFAHRTVKASAVILGDNQKFWVVSLAEMEKLLAAGYELAE
jgi:hypothetical protein